MKIKGRHFASKLLVITRITFSVFIISERLISEFMKKSKDIEFPNLDIVNHCCSRKKGRKI